MANMKNWLKLMESVDQAAPQVEEQQTQEAAECNHTAEGEECPVHGLKECGMMEELAFESWNVIYDSAHAKNVKASVRMKKDMDEAEVREWFQRVFSPMSVHEVARVAEESKIDELSPATLSGYADKAEKERDANWANSGKDADAARKYYNRKHGVQKAAGKLDLANEDQVDEFNMGSVASPSVQVKPAAGATVSVNGKSIVAKDKPTADKLAAQIKKGEIAVEADRPEQGMYKDLSDVYEPGPTEVWYWKEDAGRDMMMGKNFLLKHGKMPDPNNLAATHVKIGSVKETHPEKVFHMMQGEIWSPEGQARNMIRASGTGHTSMSVGDIVVVNGEAMMVDRFGFAKLDQEPAEESQVMEGRCHIRHSGAKALMEAHEVKLMVNDDHEVAMAQAELYRLAKDAIALHNMLDQMGNLEGWVSSKITLATDYVATVRDYIDDFVRSQEQAPEVAGSNLPVAVPSAELPVEKDLSVEARDDFDDEEEDEKPVDPDSEKVQHIVMQLKKAYDVGGNYPITFADGSKHTLDMDQITAFLKKYLAAKPLEKEEMQRRASLSLLDFQATMESMEEGVTINEKPIDTLAKIVADKQASKVKFEGGETMMVDLFSASAMMGVYHRLNKEETKDKFRKMSASKAGFLKLLDFALAKK